MMIKDDRNNWIIGGERLAREKRHIHFRKYYDRRKKWQILLANNPRLLKKCSK